MSSAPPRRIDIDADRLLEIVRQTRIRPLTEEEYQPLAAAIETGVWLQTQVREQRVDIKRLCRMLFGPSSEKTKAVFPESGQHDPNADANEAEPASGDTESTPDSDDSQSPDDGSRGDDGEDHAKGKRKGHGRRPAADYPGAHRTCVPHESLKPGEVCPACGKGKVYEQRMPKVIVRVTGGAPLEATIYDLQSLRCNLCGEVFTARAPPGIGERKYDELAAAMIGLLRYGSGLPHNRLAKLQRSLGIPLPASTQWDVVSGAAPSIAPVYDELCRLAAQAEVIHNDDTGMPVLALTGKRRAREAPADDPPARTGMFTTGIVARSGGRRIALFFTGRKHAGENLTDVLAHRAARLAAPIQMCDGLDRNLPKELSTILANCLSIVLLRKSAISATGVQAIVGITLRATTGV